MRVKVIEMDGAKYTIAPLSIEQVEQFGAPVEEKDGQTIKARGFSVVCNGLNNAKDSNGQALNGAEWNDARVKAELDPVLYDHLLEQILKFTGLSRKRATEMPVPGEGETAVTSSVASAVV